MSDDATAVVGEQPAGDAATRLVIDPAAIDPSASDDVTPPSGVPVLGLPAAPLHRRRRWLRVLLALAGLTIAYYGFNVIQVWRVGNSDQAQPVDAIVVMGAAQYDGRPSPQLQARLDHVVELWRQEAS